MLRPGAAHGYCVGLMTPAILAGIVAVRSTWRGHIAVRSYPVWRGKALFFVEGALAHVSQNNRQIHSGHHAPGRRC